ncbi:MAG: protein kinase [Vulcanimicrobiota bacterium]
MLRQIIDILSYLHSQMPPIIYRDMNPRNVMISNGTVFLVDFGIAKVLTPHQKGTAIGTAGYTAPEQS